MTSAGKSLGRTRLRTYAIATQPTGEVVAAGDQDSIFFSREFAAMRFRDDGSLDTTFGAGGIQNIAVGWEATAHAVAVHDGKIVLAGAAADKPGGQRHFALVRLLVRRGDPDTTFNRDGKVLATEVTGEFDGVAIEPDGAILAAGYQTVGKRDRFALARYRNDGRLDSTFGRGGISTFNLGGISDRANDIAIDDEGRTLLAGTTRVSQDKAKFAVARLLTSAND